MTNIFYVDGEFLPADEAHVPLSDLALIRGYGVFDFTRTYGGKPFQLEAHIERLFRSASHVDLTLPWTPDEIAEIVLATLAHNDTPECNVRIIATGGDTLDFMLPANHPRLIVMVTPVTIPPDHQYRDGIKVITVPDTRYQPQTKSLNYIPAIRAMKQARARGADEAVFVDGAGRVLEGTTNNIFAFFKDTMVTPGEGILEGITRGLVLDLAADVYHVEVRDLPLDELMKASEVFLTSSVKQVMPVSFVNGRRIGSGSPGARTQRLMALFARLTGAFVGMR